MTDRKCERFDLEGAEHEAYHDAKHRREADVLRKALDIMCDSAGLSDMCPAASSGNCEQLCSDCWREWALAKARKEMGL